MSDIKQYENQKPVKACCKKHKEQSKSIYSWREKLRIDWEAKNEIEKK